MWWKNYFIKRLTYNLSIETIYVLGKFGQRMKYISLIGTQKSVNDY